MPATATKPKKKERVKGPIQWPSEPFWAIYEVEWTFLSSLYSSVPADPEIIQKWLESRMPANKPEGARSMAEIQQEVVESVLNEAASGDAEPEEAQQFSVLVFQRHGGHLVVRADTIRAHLKDCARTISAQYLGKIEGEAAFSTRVIRGLYQDIRVPWVPILRVDGSPVIEADGSIERAIHLRGKDGAPISALKRVEFVREPIFRFRLLVMGGDRTLNQTDIAKLMEYGGVHGYGGERSLDGGKYTVTRLERAE